MPYDPNMIAGFPVPMPTLGERVRDVAFNGGVAVDHTRFSLCFNQERGFAIFTAHNIDGASILPEGEIPRRDRFRLDPDVPRHLQVDNDRAYRNNPWDRGHLVRRRALHWGARAEAEQADSESFFWTNIAPQHENLHDAAWGSIEDWLFDVADDAARKACVFTGPVMTPEDPVRVNRPGETAVRIPAGFWKIIALKHQQALRAAAFLTWQRDFHHDEPVAFDPILEQVRITTIEYLTGLDFEPLRVADPLQFGARIERVGARRRVAAASARPRAAAVTCAQDVVL